MRLLCYFHPSQDPFRLRAALQAQGWQQVAMRDGSLWRADSRPEHGWPAVCASGYPGILRAYEANGVKVANLDPVQDQALPPAPEEIEALPAAAVYAVLNPGKHLLAELEAVPLPEGAQTIAVNEAARRAPCCWQLCNDGFAESRFLGTIGEHGRITRRRFSSTIPTGRWFSLDRVGIVDGTFSTTCALVCAASAKPATVYLYGHDLLPGNGLEGLTGHWDDSQLRNVRAEVDAQIDRMRSAGIRVVHVRMAGDAVTQDDGAPAAAAKRTRRGSR